MFKTQPILQALPGGKKWQLHEALTYESSPGVFITVPEGFVTDFASVPRFLWAILPPWGRYGRAAVLHDYLYSEQDRPRSAADWLFLHAMKGDNVTWWKRQAMYQGVRLGGRIAWNDHKKRNQRGK